MPFIVQGTHVEGIEGPGSIVKHIDVHDDVQRIRRRRCRDFKIAPRKVGVRAEPQRPRVEWISYAGLVVITIIEVGGGGGCACPF